MRSNTEFDTVITHIRLLRQSYNLLLIHSLTQTLSHSQTIMQLHLFSYTFMQHSHGHQHTLTFRDMMNQTQHSPCSALHALFIMFSLVELLMNYVFCFLYTFSTILWEIWLFTNDPHRASILLRTEGTRLYHNNRHTESDQYARPAAGTKCEAYGKHDVSEKLLGTKT